MICAPRRPTSSCTVDTATTRTLSSGDRDATRRSASAAIQVPMRLSRARATMMSSLMCMNPSRKTAESPIANRALASSALLAPMSMKSSCSLRTLPSADLSCRWMAVAPIRPMTGLLTPATLELKRTRLPTIEPTSMPPIALQ